jgi:hypothetical protein
MSYIEKEYEEFVAEMEEKFPEFFIDKQYGGFCVGKGWWKIIESLCDNIQHHINQQKRLAELYAKDPSLTYLEGAKEVEFSIAQIKEKFGGLRFYYNGGDDVIDGMIRMAESWAVRTCEVCGESGIPRSGGWIRTLCDTHYNESKENE